MSHQSGKEAVFLPLPPLRSVRASFPRLRRKQSLCIAVFIALVRRRAAVHLLMAGEVAQG
jgi:hypothetical protein